MQIDDSEAHSGNFADLPVDDDEYDQANRLILNERPGRLHHSYVKGALVINKINEGVINAKKEPYRNRFQFPNFFAESDTQV